MLRGQQRGGQVSDELLQERRHVVGTHLVPAEAARVERALQLLLQELRQAKQAKKWFKKKNSIAIL